MSVPATEPAAPQGLFDTTRTTDASSSDDREMFLNLMVAQLRYQDPMNPADTGEFLAQNAQFTALEKMQQVADATSALMATQMAFGASGLVGREITYARADGTTASGTVSSVTFSADGPQLSVGGDSVPLGLVQTVHQGGAPTTGRTGGAAAGAVPVAAPTATAPAAPPTSTGVDQPVTPPSSTPAAVTEADGDTTYQPVI